MAIGTRADGSVLDYQEQAILLNTRNFAYFRDAVEQKDCAFCKFNPELNVVVAQNRNWQMWPCPPKYQAKDLARHSVMLPKRHIRHFGNLDSEEFEDFFKFFVENIMPDLSGEPLALGFGPGHPILMPRVHAEFIVPDRTRRVQAVFGPNLVSDTSFAETFSPLKTHGKWTCGRYPICLPGIADRYVIYPTAGLRARTETQEDDYEDIFELFGWLTEGELGYNVGPGTFLLALPGSAFSMRCGDIEYTAASQLHLHGNWKKPLDPLGIFSETLAKDPADIEMKKLVVAVWWKMLEYIRTHTNATEADAFDALDPDDQALLNKRK